MLGDIDIIGQRGMPEHTKIDLRNPVLHRAERFSRAFRCFQFNAVPLPVIERQGITGKAFPARPRQTCGGVETTAQQTDCFRQTTILNVKKHWRLAAAALIVVGVFIGFNIKAFDGFFQDDELDNMSWTVKAGPDTFIKGFLSPAFNGDNFRPTGHLYFRLATKAFGWSFPSFMAPIFAFHILNGFLVFLLGRKLNIPPWHALAGATFFLLSTAAFDAYWKPMYVFDLLCCTFCLASLISYQGNLYITSLLFFWCAYRSKELAVMLPGILVLYEYWLGEKRFARLIPFLVISLSFGLQGVFLNPNKDNDYSFRFNLASLEKTVPFYAERLLAFPFSAFLLAPLLLIKDKRIWLGLASVLLISFPLWFLPGRLFEAYVYVPMAFACIAMAAASTRLDPKWVLLLLLVWFPFNVKQLREEYHAKLAQDDETFSFVQSIVAWVEKNPFEKTLVYTGVPKGLNHWGVTAAWNLAHHSLGLKALFIDWPEAAQAHPRAFGSWDGRRHILYISEEQ